MQTSTAAKASSEQRWLQLGLGLVVMLAISSPQYTWTLFTKPLQATLGVSLPAVQVALPW